LKNRHIVYKFLRNSIIFRCSRAALDPLGGRVFETAEIECLKRMLGCELNNTLNQVNNAKFKVGLA